MTLTETVAKLETVLPILKASDAQFAANLIASFKKYGGLTPKQAPWVDKLIARATAPVAAPVAQVNVGGFAGVVALFVTAKAHLKFPKIRLVLNGTKLVLSLNGPASKRPGHVSIAGEGVYPNRAFYGSVSPEGVFTPFKTELAGLTGLLMALAGDAAGVAKAHAKLTGNCCFCNKVIGDGAEVRSALVGFGPDCAEHYGLKAVWLAAGDKAQAAKMAVLSESLLFKGATEAPVAAPVALKASDVAFLTATLSPVAPVVEPFTSGGLLAAVSQAPVVEAPKAAVKCFFCEKEATQTKTLHGCVICLTCASKLV